MAETGTELTKSQNMIAPGGYRFVIVWGVCLLLLYVAAASFGVAKLRGYAAESDKIRRVRIMSPTLERNAKAVDLALPSGQKGVDVQVGGIINRVGEFSLRESAWTADFNLWFRWNGDDADPGKSFRILGGQVRQQENIENSRSGQTHYAEYHIVARMTEDFDATRFPFGENGLVIQVEDNAQGPEPVRYIADKKGSGADSDAMPRGLNLTRFLATTKTGIKRTGKVSPDAPAERRETRSQFILAMLVLIDGIGLYQKFFQALFASVAVSLIALYIKPIHVDCRFGLPVGGFFAAVGNNIFVGTLMPHAERLTLADMVNATGLFTIFFILVLSAISLHIYDTLGRERLSRLFDRASFVVFLIGYLTVNIALPISARPL